jgi:hypothetical protein
MIVSCFPLLEITDNQTSSSTHPSLNDTRQCYLFGALVCARARPQLEERERARPVKPCPAFFNDATVQRESGFGIVQAYVAAVVVLVAVLAETVMKLDEWTAAGDKRVLLFSTAAPREYR